MTPMSNSTSPPLPILLVDDEVLWTRSLSRMLERSGGYGNLLTCHDSREVMGILAHQPVSLVLLDLTMPHLSGDDLLGTIAQEYPDIPVIILTGRDQVDMAVKCMKNGAFDYFVKTVEEERLLAGVQRAIRMQQLQRENQVLKTRLGRKDLKCPAAFAAILTGDRQMESLFHYLETVAPTSQPVLITGESGVGKELFARAVHEVGRPGKPWVGLNVAGLDDNIFADTLFGHSRGAFTGADRERAGLVEQARGGTLFLDEIGDLSLGSQVKLLRLLQEGEYYPVGSDRPKRSGARIVLATNVDLTARQACGAFRKDLYYRLRTHHIHIAPLRERSEDISLLLHLFLEEAAAEFGKKKPTAPPELSVLLATHPFPGNIRELRAMVFEAVSHHQGGVLSTRTFRMAMGLAPSAAAGESLTPGANGSREGISYGERLPTLTQGANILVEEAMRRAQGNQTIAAGMLGISRPALSKRLRNQRP
jgi:DNA-binding NtrC family response regulator